MKNLFIVVLIVATANVAAQNFTGAITRAKTSNSTANRKGDNVTSNAGFTGRGMISNGNNSGATYYVSTSGSDSNSGSSSAPFASINYASSRVSPGDVVIVKDGTYYLSDGSFSGDVSIGSSGTSDAPILYMAQHKWKAKLVGVGTGDGSVVVGVHGSYNTIQGFDITGSNANGIILSTSGTTTSYNVAIGNYVHDIHAPCSSNGGSAISSGGGDNYNAGVGHMSIIANIIVNVIDAQPCSGLPHGAGIFQSVPYGIVANNIVINGGRWAIESWHQANHEIYFGNVVINGGSGIIMGAGDSPNLGNVNDYSLVQNNIVVNASDIAYAETGSTGSHNQYINNLAYGGAARFSLKNGLQAIGSVFKDPLFINNNGSVTGNYGLQIGSPARGAGLAIAEVSVDYDGNPYPRAGSITDIGAILYGAGFSSSSNPYSYKH